VVRVRFEPALESAEWCDDLAHCPDARGVAAVDYIGGQSLPPPILITMVWFSLAGGLNRRRKTQQLRKEAMESVAPPDANHPALGLGGRSIELSLSVGREIDPEAFELAASELHSHVVQKDWPTAALLQDARWLMSLTGVASITPASRAQVSGDLDSLTK
jgi:hypothetical protein